VTKPSTPDKLPLTPLVEYEAAARVRLAALQARSETAPDPDILSNALQDWSRSLEELQVAEEELRVQNEELLHVNQELLKERQRYVELFDLSPEPSLLTDSVGSIVRANHAAARLLGVPPDHLTRKPLASFIGAPFRQEFRQRLLRLAQGESPAAVSVEFELHLTTRQGNVVERVARLRSGGSNGSGLPLTHWTLLEPTLARWSAEELEEFTEAAAHDLREPLRGIVNLTQLLALRYGGKLGAGGDEYIKLVGEEVERLDAMVHGLLAYLQVGSRTFDHARVDLREAVNAASVALRGRMNRNGVTVTPTGNLPVVRGDGARLAELLRHLFENAAKFHKPEEPVRIQVSAEADPHDPAWYIVSVHDNGIGIEPDHQQRIFGLFRRLHTRQEYPGSGTGLTMCRKIVERHGGQIWVDPNPEGGTVFRFTLPAWRRP